MEKKPNRFVPGAQEPWQKWYWINNEALNTYDAVPLKQGWPSEDEPVTDAIAWLAISHRKGDIIERYLQQPNPSPHIIARIASLFGRSKNGAEPDRVDFVKRRNDHPILQERTRKHRLQIGSEIYCMVEDGMKLKQAIAAVSSKYENIKRSSALDAYKFYKNSQLDSPN
jgi:hypothetical protein